MAKKQKWKEGDVFAIKLLDGSFSFGQALYITKQALSSVVCAFFDFRQPLNGEKISINSLKLDDLLSVQYCSTGLLDSGGWAVVGHLPLLDVSPHINVADIKAGNFVGVKVVGSANFNELMNAYYGLSPWNDFHDPFYLDKLLVSTRKRPSNVILK